jgi:hypothetical protein
MCGLGSPGDVLCRVLHPRRGFLTGMTVALRTASAAAVLAAVGVIVFLARRLTTEEPVGEAQPVASRSTATSRATAAV